MNNLKEILTFSASRHSHLCPRQVLGARLGLAGAAALGLDVPRKDKRLLVILETDGCFADGIEASTGCTVGHRTLRIEDYGKIAATFVNVQTSQAVRLAPRLDVRQRACEYGDGETRHYFAQLQAYQIMPEAELLTLQPVQLKIPVEKIVSRAGVRVNCQICGEEIINEREITIGGGHVLCQACALGGYYTPQLSEMPISVELAYSGEV
jgi:formylmethanofuran dehydrogenase subunit E